MSEQKVHWRKIIESEYLAGADLDDGKGGHPPITVTIREAKREEVLEPSTSRKEVCLVLQFVERVKPMICNVTNAKTISKILGSNYIEDWAGKRIAIGTERVKAFGDVWDALRVKPVAPKATDAPQQAATPCADCKQVITDHQGIAAVRIAADTNKKYGRPLCVECAAKVRKQEEQPNAAE